MLVVDGDGRVVGHVVRVTRLDGTIQSVTIDAQAAPLAPSDPCDVVFYRVKSVPGRFRSRFCPGIYRLA